MVLYHDPVRLTSEQRECYVAGHSVWVCRDDRYAFEVIAFAPRATHAGDPSPERCGEARFRLAMALAAVDVARSAAICDPFRHDVVVTDCVLDDLSRLVNTLDPGCRVNFGAVIGRFEVVSSPEVLHRVG